MENYYNNIKNLLINNEVYKKVKDYSKNKHDLTTYYEVGKQLASAGKHYGEGIIKQYSIKLTNELGKGYTYTTLTRMKKFYEIIGKVAPVAQTLSWSHMCELLPIDDINKINYYIKITNERNLSKRKLREAIKNQEYERLDDKTKEKLINKEDNIVTDFIKEPILIKSNNKLKDEISEKALKQCILEDMDNFLLELGEGFCYIANEYKIKIGDRYNYIDLLLYNIKHSCYVVVELKITELKKEHIGQIETYMNYIDKNLRRIDQDKTIGIIIVRKNNQFIMQYCSDSRIMSKEYELV